VRFRFDELPARGVEAGKDRVARVLPLDHRQVTAIALGERLRVHVGATADERLVVTARGGLREGVVERTGDAIFPGLDAASWQLVESESHPESDPPFRFETWDRRRT
jgi:hypothetical protein